MAIVRADGQVLLDPWINPDTGNYASFVLGSGAPLTGELRLVLSGGQASVFINGSKVGPTRPLEGPQLTGTIAGFGVYQNGRASRVEITAS